MEFITSESCSSCRKTPLPLPLTPFPPSLRSFKRSKITAEMTAATKWLSCTDLNNYILSPTLSHIHTHTRTHQQNWVNCKISSLCPRPTLAQRFFLFNFSHTKTQKETGCWILANKSHMTCVCVWQRKKGRERERERERKREIERKRVLFVTERVTPLPVTSPPLHSWRSLVDFSATFRGYPTLRSQNDSLLLNYTTPLSVVQWGTHVQQKKKLAFSVGLLDQEVLSEYFRSW